jgi:Isoprenylcysteine carboxyl methyltransferase (ICMT) family
VVRVASSIYAFATHPVILSSSAKRYVTTRPIGRPWIALWVGTAAIELTGALRRRRSDAERRRQPDCAADLSHPGGIVNHLSEVRSCRGHRFAACCCDRRMVLFGVGEGPRVWSRFSLGRYFTYTVQTSSDQPVITNGPYRFVRHPSYTGVLLMVLGAGLAWSN